MAKDEGSARNYPCFSKQEAFDILRWLNDNRDHTPSIVDRAMVVSANNDIDERARTAAGKFLDLRDRCLADLLWEPRGTLPVGWDCKKEGEGIIITRPDGSTTHVASKSSSA